MTIKKLEKILNRKVIKDTCVLGIDTASRTGWAEIKTTKKTVTINYGVVHLDTKDIYYKYDKLIEIFQNMITNQYKKVIIEDTHLKRYKDKDGTWKANVWMLKLLSRIGMIPYIFATLNSIDKIFLTPSGARSILGIKGNVKKEEVHKWLNTVLGLKIEDKDASDAIVLALNGIII